MTARETPCTVARGTLVLFASLAVLAGACRSDGGERRREPARPAVVAPRIEPRQESAADAGPEVARVGGHPIHASELLEQWFQRDSVGLWQQIELLVAGELARLEAERLGVRVAPSDHQRRVSAHLGALRERWAERYPGIAFDTVLRERLLLDPDRFRQRLGDETLRELVTERVVRYSSLTKERVRVRILTVEDRDEARELARRVRAGEDFAALARAHSLDATAEVGGLLPPIAYDPSAPLARLAFQAPIGRVDGPFELGGRQLLLLAEERLAPLRGGYGELAEAVESSLREAPIHEAEFIAWQLEAQRRWPVDLSSLHRLLGEPAPLPPQ